MGFGADTNGLGAQAGPRGAESTHGAHGGITREQGRKILAAGGIIYPYQGNAQSWTEDLKVIAPLKSQQFDFAMGFGADTNGLGAQAGPRGADRNISSFELERLVAAANEVLVTLRGLHAGRHGVQDDYLRGLVRVVHYAEHAEADLRDAWTTFQNVFAVVSADRNISSFELERLVAAANEVLVTLRGLHAGRHGVQ
ncbi:hypothetical protein [Mycobacterium tuberculosis]|uniref:hypothetical protein n=1 Tax=Mycobacterium tuberculosis TaxID=1773 RepID=UPI00272C87E7|nr:hypothetical protein [Mycobacterium tuberculosis]